MLINLASSYASQVVGSVYSEDFSGYTLGDTTVAGFTSRWAPITREIVSDASGQALRIAATTLNTRGVFTYDAVDNDPEREKISLFMTARTPVEFGVARLAGRVAGSSGSETAAVGGTSTDDQIRIDQYDAGSFTQLEIGNFAHAGQTLNILVKFDGSVGTLKMWIDGDPEPASPQVTATTTITGAGYAGIFTFTSQDPIDVVFLSIATGDREPLRQPNFDEPAGTLSADTELAAIVMAESSVDATTVALSPPTNVSFSGVTDGWGNYFAVVEGVDGTSLALEIRKAADAGGVISSDAHVAVWSSDPHSDNWTSLPYLQTVNDRLTFDGILPDQPTIAIARAPGYTLTRVYAKTSEYRQNSLVLDAPSATNGNYGVQVSPNDWRGTAVPDLDLPVYRIGDGTQTGKNVVVLTAGNHPYEMHADYNLEGAVEFLLGSTTEAQFIRQWCDIFVYPTINPAGRWAGYTRSNPELKAAGEHDHNRVWAQTGWDTVDKLKAAFTADFGGTCDVLIDFHTFFFYDTNLNRGIWAPNEVSNPAFMTRYATRETATTNNRFVGASTTPEALPEYAINAMGATVAIHSEESPLASRNVPEYRASGQALMLALHDMINDGLLPNGP